MTARATTAARSRSALRGILATLCAVGLLLFGAVAQADVAIPPVARVTDLTGTLSAQQQQALSAKLAAFEKSKGSQIAVLMIPTTKPETIEQYGIRVADAWKLGRKGVDDGLIFLIAKNDHKARLEVGYGLEGVVPDATANEIIDRIIIPYFRKGDFYGGIDAGVDTLVKVINGEPLPPPKHHESRQERRINPLAIAFIVFVVMMMIGRGLHRHFGLGVTSAGVGIGTGVIFGLVAASLVGGLIVGIIGLVLGLMMLGGGGGGGFGGPMGGIGYMGMGGFGGFGGGGFGGGGLGGGGFSGGGGGFGGGGASGGW